MGAWYFKQPDGRFGRFSTVVDTVTHCNMTKEELYKDMVDRFGKYDVDVVDFDKFVDSDETSHRGYYMHTFGEVLSSITNSNETTESVQTWLKDMMGFTEEEASKYYFMDEPETEDFNDPIWDTYDCVLQKRDS